MSVASDDAERRTVAVRFLLDVDPSPGLLSRVLEPFAKRDLTPDSVQASREGEWVRAEFLLRVMPAEMVHLVAGNLGQVFGVISVRVEVDSALKLAA